MKQNITSLNKAKSSTIMQVYIMIQNNLVGNKEEQFTI